MIPIRNRKKTLQVTVDEMRNFAFAYVEKYAPSKQQLKTHLLKKYMKLSASDVRKKDVNKLIDIVLSDLEKNKFINDQFYSESKAKSMIQRGNSINKIRNYLIGKGINETFIQDTVDKIKEDNSDQDFFSAIKLCKKKRIGPARAEDNTFRSSMGKSSLILYTSNIYRSKPRFTPSLLAISEFILLFKLGMLTLSNTLFAKA